MTFYDIHHNQSKLLRILARHFDLEVKSVPNKRKNNVKIMMTKKVYSQDPILSLKDFFTVRQLREHDNMKSGHNRSYKGYSNNSNSYEPTKHKTHLSNAPRFGGVRAGWPNQAPQFF